jgi:acetoin utilization deacetylase AcuC-like enzyme
VKVVYDNRYRTVYSSDPASALGRIESIHEELKSDFEFIEPKPAKEEDILLVHSQHHVDMVKTHPLVYETALLAAGGAIEASEIAMQNEPAFGLIRPPGHHASRDSSWGFCYFNNIAVAIEKLRIETKIKKALIIDIDLHYGDGTANIFASSPNVTYHHPEGTSRQAYIDNLTQFLQGYKESFDILAISAGFDRHEQDWGGLLKTQDYQTIGTLAKEVADNKCNNRTFAVLEGGYNHTVLGKNVKALLNGMT